MFDRISSTAECHSPSISAANTIPSSYSSTSARTVMLGHRRSLHTCLYSPRFWALWQWRSYGCCVRLIFDRHSRVSQTTVMSQIGKRQSSHLYTRQRFTGLTATRWDVIAKWRNESTSRNSRFTRPRVDLEASQMEYISILLYFSCMHEVLHFPTV